MMYEYVELMLCGNMFSIVQLKECEYERHVARNSVTIQQKLHRGLVISGIRRNQQPNDTAFVVESFPYDSPDERGFAVYIFPVNLRRVSDATTPF
jgi:hypothetical protein